MKIRYYISILLLSICFLTNAKTIIFNKDDAVKSIGKEVSIYTDVSGQLNVTQILSLDSFKVSNHEIPNLGISESFHWVEIVLQNKSESEDLLLEISNPILDYLQLFTIKDGIPIHSEIMGDELPFSSRSFYHQKFIFKLKIPKGEQKKYLLKIKSWEQISLNISIGNPEKIYEAILIEDLIFGIYFGIIIALVLYNLFIFIRVKDLSYLYYVIFILEL